MQKQEAKDTIIDKKLESNFLPSIGLSTLKFFESDYLFPDHPDSGLIDPDYKWPVNYKFNSRGFRDKEWPTNDQELKTAIWCVGDSTTVGTGSPINHTWCYQLEQQSSRRTINISMAAASNDWISRQVLKILDEITPETIVIQWSFIHRREKPLDEINLILNDAWKKHYNNVKGPSWPVCPNIDQIDSLPRSVKFEIFNKHDPRWQQLKSDICLDENRRFFFAGTSDAQDVENLLNHIKNIENSKGKTTVIHSAGPDFAPPGLKDSICSSISQLTSHYTGEVKKIDLARDRRHYDIKTSKHFTNQILSILQNTDLLKK